MNRLTYLYQNGYYWSMSPAAFNDSSTTTGVFLHGAIEVAGGDASGSIGLRPVINLQ